MNSHEVLILFVGTLLVSILAISTLYSVVQGGTGEVSTVASDVKRSLGDYTVIEVSRGTTETNVYVQGVSGSIPIEGVLAVVNGVSYTPSVVVLYDSREKNVLNSGDVLMVSIPIQTTDSDCIKLRIGGVYTTVGLC